MISLIIQSYFIILLSIGLGSVFILMAGLYFIFKKKEKTASLPEEEKTDEQLDIDLPANKEKKMSLADDLGLVIGTNVSSLTNTAAPLATDTLSDILAIAGEDVIATQLDLARAYIEIDKKHSAKIILAQVMQTGNSIQQEEAHRLLTVIEC